MIRAQIFVTNSATTENDEDLFAIETVLDDIATFCSVLRNLAYTLSNDLDSGVNMDHFHQLIQVVYRLKVQS